MRTLTVLEWILRIAGLGALILGLLVWIVQLKVIPIHMLFGLAVALTLLIISLLACSPGERDYWPPLALYTRLSCRSLA